MKNENTTMHIKNSFFQVNSSSVAHIGLRQIYRFDYLNGGKFGSLGYRTEKALYLALLMVSTTSLKNSLYIVNSFIFKIFLNLSQLCENSKIQKLAQLCEFLNL